MLTIIESPEQLPYSALMEIYESSNRIRGAQNYPQCAPTEQLLLAEQDFYAYLQDVLSSKLAIVALWLAEGRAMSSLRLEKYQDGFLLAGIETVPAERGRGYASALMHAVVSKFPNTPIYSHVYNENRLSVMLHEKCGFRRITDSAVLLDGNTTSEASTYLFAE